MGIGAVCHTLNPRLFAEQLCYIINHAEDRMIFTDLTFLPILLEHRDAACPRVEQVVVLTDEEHMARRRLPGALCFETLIEQHRPDVRLGRLRREHRLRRSATPRAPPAIPRACSIRTAPTSCTPW